MSWDYIDSSQFEDYEIILYKKNNKYMIRANGYELMNGFCADSEEFLSYLSGCFTPFTDKPRILLGGLGLGYSLCALHETFGDLASITVSEISSTIISWCRDIVQKPFFAELPSNITIKNVDVAKLFNEKDTYDLILLDLDNGPDAITTSENNNIYSKEGLERIYNSLSDCGNLLLWSSFEDKCFEARVESVGFNIVSFPISITASKNIIHYIHRCFKIPIDTISPNHQSVQAICYDYYCSNYSDDLLFYNDWLDDNKTVLEVGVGTGRIASQLAKKSKSYVGLEYSWDMIRILKRKLLNIEVIHGDMRNFNLSEKFDRIILPFRVIQYCSNKEEIHKTIKCILNHLDYGGKVLINMLPLDTDFYRKCNGKTYVDDFIAFDGYNWRKEDFIEVDLENQKLYRKVSFFRENQMVGCTDESIVWLSARELSDMLVLNGLKVSYVYKAFNSAEYDGNGEFLIEGEFDHALHL